MARTRKPLRLFKGYMTDGWYGVTLNADGVTIRDRYPLPEMEALLEQESGKALTFSDEEIHDIATETNGVEPDMIRTILNIAKDVKKESK